MIEVLVIKEKLGNLHLPERIKQAIKGDKCKINASSITAERAINLYGLRRESNFNDPAYREVNLEIEKILKHLKGRNNSLVLLVNIISPEVYAIIFTNEEVDEAIGVLDLTGLGKTGDYTATLFT